jgi:2-polyprenyl-3-methyl-5-hydroxy-6-metoxy-1,4-benzoquinol methylase
MSLRHSSERPQPSFAEIQNDSRVLRAVSEHGSLLPMHKNAAILDIGFGGGWFIAACVKLGYTNISGADLGIANKSQRPEQYDFIHMSHVIEHIPKYSLLWLVDAIFRALKKDGVLLLRTPNMEGPTPNSSLYVTFAHEYGFAGSNLKSLLDICGFDNITFQNPPQNRPTLNSGWAAFCVGRFWR